MKLEKGNSKQQARFLKLLIKTNGTGLPVAISGSKIIATFNNRTFTFPIDVFTDALAKNAIEHDGKVISITGIGTIIARRLLHPESEFQNPQQQWTTSSATNHDPSPAEYAKGIVRNLSESPLMRLYSRKGKDGQAYITIEEFTAGEKFRSDFERANLQPSVTASWNSNVAGKSSAFVGNQHADMTDFSLDNRKYVEKAITSLGPELSGIALDICCFLKGFESVEHERRWPPRSAKLMLKTALSVLARHYGLSQDHGRASGKIEHWGGAKYRPTINAG